jgi:hypothetical protein
MYSSVDTKYINKPISKTRVRCSATFECVPKLFGFGDDVRFVSAIVDHNRNIISFYFTGDGLKDHYPDAKVVPYEGQECIEVIPPAWVS